MDSQVPGKEEFDASEDFLGAQGLLLVVPDQLGRQDRDLVEDVVDHRVHDVHGLLADPLLRVDLLQHLVDVQGEGFLSLLSPLLAQSARDVLHSLVTLAGVLQSFL